MNKGPLVSVPEKVSSFEDKLEKAKMKEDPLVSVPKKVSLFEDKLKKAKMNGEQDKVRMYERRLEEAKEELMELQNTSNIYFHEQYK